MTEYSTKTKISPTAITQTAPLKDFALKKLQARGITLHTHSQWLDFELFSLNDNVLEQAESGTRYGNPKHSDYVTNNLKAIYNLGVLLSRIPSKFDGCESTVSLGFAVVKNALFLKGLQNTMRTFGPDKVPYLIVGDQDSHDLIEQLKTFLKMVLEAEQGQSDTNELEFGIPDYIEKNVNFIMEKLTYLGMASKDDKTPQSIRASARSILARRLHLLENQLKYEKVYLDSTGENANSTGGEAHSAANTGGMPSSDSKSTEMVTVYFKENTGTSSKLFRVDKPPESPTGVNQTDSKIIKDQQKEGSSGRHADSKVVPVEDREKTVEGHRASINLYIDPSSEIEEIEEDENLYVNQNIHALTEERKRLKQLLKDNLNQIHQLETRERLANDTLKTVYETENLKGRNRDLDWVKEFHRLLVDHAPQSVTREQVLTYFSKETHREENEQLMNILLESLEDIRTFRDPFRSPQYSLPSLLVNLKSLVAKLELEKISGQLRKVKLSSLEAQSRLRKCQEAIHLLNKKTEEKTNAVLQPERPENQPSYPNSQTNQLGDVPLKEGQKNMTLNRSSLMIDSETPPKKRSMSRKLIGLLFGLAGMSVLSLLLATSLGYLPAVSGVIVAQLPLFLSAATTPLLVVGTILFGTISLASAYAIARQLMDSVSQSKETKQHEEIKSDMPSPLRQLSSTFFGNQQLHQEDRNNFKPVYQPIPPENPSENGFSDQSTPTSDMDNISKPEHEEPLKKN